MERYRWLYLLALVLLVLVILVTTFMPAASA
jgi:hypothetical protein